MRKRGNQALTRVSLRSITIMYINAMCQESSLGHVTCYAKEDEVTIIHV